MRRLSQPVSAMLTLIVTVAAIDWSLSMAQRSVVFAFAINWALMGCAYILWLVLPLRFFDGYYRIHPFERSGRLYDALAVPLFQLALRRSGFHGARVFPSYARGPQGAEALVAATIGPETAHCLIFVVVNVLALDAGLHRGWWDTAGWLFAFNVLLNAYPVLSLRQVRVRVERLFPGALLTTR